MGVRKQTLLYYFPTKDALFEACVVEVSARVAIALTEALAGEQEPSRKAETVIRTLATLMARNLIRTEGRRYVSPDVDALARASDREATKNA